MCGWLLLLLSGSLALIAVAAGISVAVNGGAIGGGVFVLLLAGVLGQFGVVVLRGGERPSPLPATGLVPGGRSQAEALAADGPPTDPTARYGELFS
jgi:hypothetical protein